MKRFLIVLIAFLLIPLCTFAAENDDYNDYLNTYDLSFFEEKVDNQTYSILDELGITDFSYESISSISLSKVVSIIKSLVLGNIESPLESILIVLAYVLLSAFFQNFKQGGIESLSDVYSTASALIISTVLFVKIGDTLIISSSAIEIASNFIYAFIPVFSAIVIASGGVNTAFSTNAMLLTLAQCLSFISSTVFIPLINCFLAIGICSSLRYQLRLDRLLSTIKKTITTMISFVSACFVSILSIKTAVASKADAIGLRSIRFAINSVVPVIGSAISEGLLSIQSYSSLLKSSVGVVGIVAIVFIFLPSILKVVIWRFALNICKLISDIFGDNSVSQTLNAFGDTMLLINVVLILSMVTTIISIGILIAARNA